MPYSIYNSTKVHSKFSKLVSSTSRVKKIILLNTVELKLLSTVKIHLVVNVSRILRYVEQVKGQRKEQLALVIIKGEDKWEVQKILSK